MKPRYLGFGSHACPLTVLETWVVLAALPITIPVLASARSVGVPLHVLCSLIDCVRACTVLVTLLFSRVAEIVVGSNPCMVVIEYFFCVTSS